MEHTARICSIDLPLMGQQPLSLGNMEAPQQAISSSGGKAVIGFSWLKK
jgi:hypothetical protein